MSMETKDSDSDNEKNTGTNNNTVSPEIKTCYLIQILIIIPISELRGTSQVRFVLNVIFYETSILTFGSKTTSFLEKCKIIRNFEFDLLCFCTPLLSGVW